MVKDSRLELQHYMTGFYVSERAKFEIGSEPLRDTRTILVVAPVERRVPSFTKGTFEVSADKEQDV